MAIDSGRQLRWIRRGTIASVLASFISFHSLTRLIPSEEAFAALVLVGVVTGLLGGVRLQPQRAALWTFAIGAVAQLAIGVVGVIGINCEPCLPTVPCPPCVTIGMAIAWALGSGLLAAAVTVAARLRSMPPSNSATVR